jgi:hypothetical protein
MKIILLTLLAVLPLSTKTTIIYIENTMEKATTRQLITVYGYKDDMMLYGISTSKDTLKTSCIFRDDSEKNRIYLVEHKAIKPTDLAGKWPDAGEKVLFIEEERTVLFAKIQGDIYRFWDPKSSPFANSVFSMEAGSAYVPLEECLADKNETYNMCTDGCLAPKEYINKKYNLK